MRAGGGQMLARWAFALGLVALVALAGSLSGGGVGEGAWRELLSGRRGGRGENGLRVLPRREQYSMGFGAEPLWIHRDIDQEDASYAAGFPHSYFAAQPNPNSKYAWTCMGPSELDDPHSGACPQSSTGGFRCCLDTANGGAVADDLCCPKKEVELQPMAERESRRLVERRLDTVLLKIVEKLERQQVRPPAQNPDYITAAQANDDIASYFDGLSAKPSKVRSMKSTSAQKDLQDFFQVLSKGDIGGLLPRAPQPEKVVVPRPGDRSAVREVAGRLAGQVVLRDESDSVREQNQEYEDWRRRSEGRRGERPGDGVLKRMVDEEFRDRGRAEEAGRESAKEWGAFRQPYFTDVPGSKPARAAAGAVRVPLRDIRVAQ